MAICDSDLELIMKPLRIALLLLLMICSPVGLVRSLNAQEDVSAPNIVMILADDMGFGDVQCLNQSSTIPTPNLDQLASDGMTFTDGHSPSGVCTPTRYGLLTGRYCWRTRLKRGVLGGYSEPLLETDRETIGTMLQAAGYYTGAVGKWHLGMNLPYKQGVEADTSKWAGDPGIDFGGVISDSPIHHGFNEYFGVSASLDMAPYVYVRNDRFTMLPTLQQEAVRFPHFVRQGPRAEDFIIDEVLDKLTEEAVSFIQRSSEKDQPFFLYMPLTGPHKPTQPHERFRGKTGLNEYGDFIVQVDWTVGQVMKALDDVGVADNTLVMFSSDNGSYMFRYDEEREDHVSDATIQGYLASHHRANGPFRGTKADIYEAGHHVPFFVRWPGKVEPGSKCSEPVCLTDCFATFAQVAGTEPKPGAAEDSFSMVGMLRGEELGRGVPVIHHSAGGMFAIRDGDWKLIAGNGSGGRERPSGKPFEKPYQLYNMSEDIGEQKNLIDEHPEIVEELLEKLESIRNSDEE